MRYRNNNQNYNSKSQCRNPKCKCCSSGENSDQYCDKVLADAHKLFAESDDCFLEAQKAFNEELVQKIFEALELLRKVGYLEDKGVALDEEGKLLLATSGCDFVSNKDDPRCKAIYDKAVEQFICEQNAQDMIASLLKDVLEQIKIGAECDNKGDDLITEYEKCIHEDPQRISSSCGDDSCMMGKNRQFLDNFKKY